MKTRMCLFLIGTMVHSAPSIAYEAAKPRVWYESIHLADTSDIGDKNTKNYLQCWLDAETETMLGDYSFDIPRPYESVAAAVRTEDIVRDLLPGDQTGFQIDGWIQSEKKKGIPALGLGKTMTYFTRFETEAIDNRFVIKMQILTGGEPFKGKLAQTGSGDWEPIGNYPGAAFDIELFDNKAGTRVEIRFRGEVCATALEGVAKKVPGLFGGGSFDKARKGILKEVRNNLKDIEKHMKSWVRAR